MLRLTCFFMLAGNGRQEVIIQEVSESEDGRNQFGFTAGARAIDAQAVAAAEIH